MVPEVHQRNPWILHIFSLRMDREQHVPDSSNHSLHLIKLFSFSKIEGNFGGNQLMVRLVSHLLPPSSTTTPHTHNTTQHHTQHTETDTEERAREKTEKEERETEKETQPFSSLLHHLPGADMCVYIHTYIHTHKYTHLHCTNTYI